MKNRAIVPVLCLLITIAFAGYYFYTQANEKPLRHLPYFGEKKPAAGDTIYHTIPDFSFLNQDGKTITKKDVAGKIYVADYFFTTCKSICPIMKKQMDRLYKNFLNDSGVMFLSHTVDPETDSVETLKEFAKQFNADSKKWLFLTGDKKSLYDVARKGYLLDANEGDGGPEDFIHTQNFALIDPAFHIRGYYNGTDSADMNRLMIDISVLKMESAKK